MKKKTRHLLIGIITVIISIGVLYFNLSLFQGSFNKLWPALILLLGMILYIYYFSTKKKKNRLLFIFLASFTALSSVPLFILTFTSFKNLVFVWPVFLLALGIGILSLYFYGEKKRINLSISIIVIALSFIIWIFYAAQSPFGLLIGVILLITGAAFLTRGLIHEIQVPAEPTQKKEDNVSENTEDNDNRSN